MPSVTTELRLEAVIRTPATAVWRAIADSGHRRAWWPYLDLDATVGGRLLERWRGADGREQRTVGEVLAAEPGRLLRCTWRDEAWEAPTEVELALGEADGVTRVRLRHSGWVGLADDAPLLAAHREGWMRHLENLTAYAERAWGDGRADGAHPAPGTASGALERPEQTGALREGLASVRHGPGRP